MRLESGIASVRMKPVAIDMTVVAKAIAPLADSTSFKHGGYGKTLNGKRQRVPHDVWKQLHKSLGRRPHHATTATRRLRRGSESRATRRRAALRLILNQSSSLASPI